MLLFREALLERLHEFDTVEFLIAQLRQHQRCASGKVTASVGAHIARLHVERDNFVELIVIALVIEFLLEDVCQARPGLHRQVERPRVFGNVALVDPNSIAKDIGLIE